MVIISHAVVKAVLVIYIENRLSEPKQVPLPCLVFILCLVVFIFLYLMLIVIMCVSKNVRVFYYNVQPLMLFVMVIVLDLMTFRNAVCGFADSYQWGSNMSDFSLSQRLLRR
jgi:uncharacterized membrane protein